jgi:hypothetical protein
VSIERLHLANAPKIRRSHDTGQQKMKEKDRRFSLQF